MNTHNLLKFSKVVTLAQIGNKLHEANDKESLSLIGFNHHSFYHISDCLLPVISDILDRADFQIDKGGCGDA